MIGWISFARKADASTVSRLGMMHRTAVRGRQRRLQCKVFVQAQCDLRALRSSQIARAKHQAKIQLELHLCESQKLLPQ